MENNKCLNDGKANKKKKTATKANCRKLQFEKDAETNGGKVRKSAATIIDSMYFYIVCRENGFCSSRFENGMCRVKFGSKNSFIM